MRAATALLAGALLAAGPLSSGCRPATQPTAEVPDPGHALQRQRPDAGVSSPHGGAAGVPVGEDSSLFVDPHGLTWLGITVPDPVATQTFELQGAVGGTFSVGRYQVYFPANAVEGDGEVTLTVSDGATVGVELGISPQPLNGFHKPVLLSINCLGTNGGLPLPKEATIYWEATPDKCRDMQAQHSHGNSRLTAKLWHFSKYRAGW